MQNIDSIARSNDRAGEVDGVMVEFATVRALRGGILSRAGAYGM